MLDTCWAPEFIKGNKILKNQIKLNINQSENILVCVNRDGKVADEATKVLTIERSYIKKG